MEWLIWLAAVAVSFAALEGWALLSNPDRTLSARLRTWLGISPRRPIRHVTVPLFTAAVVAVPVWLITHLLG